MYHCCEMYPVIKPYYSKLHHETYQSEIYPEIKSKLK